MKMVSLRQQAKAAIIPASMRPVTERVRTVVTTINHKRDIAIPTGYEGIARSMSVYPTFTNAETDIAIRAYREGATVRELMRVQPFRGKLAVEEASNYLRKPSPYQGSYQLLFTEKRIDGDPVTIPDIVSLAHHDLILHWISAYDAMFRDLTLPLDEFFTHALSVLMPHEVNTYNPDVVPESFRSWASRMLFWRLHGVAQKRTRELRSLPVNMKPTHTTAFKDVTRQSIVSLDAPPVTHNGNGDMTSYADRLADPRPGESPYETTTAIRLLFQAAGLTDLEAEALLRVALFDETSTEAGSDMRRNERTVRLYRDKAIEKLLAVGDKKTLAAIMRGEGIPGTKEGQRDTIQVTPQNQRPDIQTTQTPQPEDKEETPGKQATPQEVEPPTRRPAIEKKVRPDFLACLCCGKQVKQPTYKSGKAKQYCNSTCRNRVHREKKRGEIEPIQCPACPTLFIPIIQKGKKQKYCSDTCRLSTNWKAQAERRKAKRHQAREGRRKVG